MNYGECCGVDGDVVSVWTNLEEGLIRLWGILEA